MFLTRIYLGLCYGLDQFITLSTLVKTCHDSYVMEDDPENEKYWEMKVKHFKEMDMVFDREYEVLEWIDPRKKSKGNKGWQRLVGLYSHGWFKAYSTFCESF